MSAAATATKRETIYTARQAAEASLATAQATLVISQEWRAFARMRFHQRVWWVLTGRGPHLRVQPPRMVTTREDKVAS